MTFNPVDYNDTCYIVAGGPSLKGFNWSLLDGKFVIAINKSYEILPNAQIVYFTDSDFWNRHKERMLKHSGRLIRGAIDPTKEQQHERVKFYKLTGPHGLEEKEGCLKHGSNSTYAALNMATVHLGFKNVYLLGVDMKWGKQGKRETHWHGGYKQEGGRVDNERVYNKMMKAYATISKPLKEKGFNVINVNNTENTALTEFPIKPAEEIFK